MVCYDIGNEQEIGNNIWGHNDMEIVWVLYLCIFVSRCNFFVFLMANKLNVKASRLSSCDKMEIAHTRFSTSVYNLNKLGNQPQVLSREWISMVCFMYPTFQSVMRLLCLTAMCNGLTALWPSGARHGKHRFRQPGAKPVSEPVLTYFQLDLREQVSDISTKIQIFSFKKLHFKCHLPNSNHFVQSLMR